jgi:ABC-type nitrate/sulfonate/bicarbonate transport system permease component
MPESVMSSKLAMQLRLFISIFFLLLIVGVWTVLSSLYETDAFVMFSFATVAGFFVYAIMSDAQELNKHSS